MPSKKCFWAVDLNMSNSKFRVAENISLNIYEIVTQVVNQLHSIFSTIYDKR
jgi:hypothetical protein